MLFLRLMVFLIIVLGVLLYLISGKVRAEFVNNVEKINPSLMNSKSVFKEFCKNPRTPYISQLIKTKKRLTIALIISVLVFLIAVSSVVYQKVYKTDDHPISKTGNNAVEN